MPHVQLRYHASRALRHRSPNGGLVSAVEATPSNTYAQNIVDGMSSTTRSVAIACGILTAAIIFGVCIWKFRIWKLRKSNRPVALERKIFAEKNSMSYGDEKHAIDLSAAYVEKPKAVYYLEPTPPLDTPVGWAPQVTTHRGITMTTKQLSTIKASPKKYAKWEKKVLKLEGSPPPSYYAANGGPSIIGSIPIPPTPPETAKRTPPTPPTPPANRSKHRQLVPPSPPSEPLPSPARSASFAFEQMKKPSHAKSDSKDSSKLMKVANTFAPNLADELHITVGDTVRMLEQYEDGWCFVQLVGRMDSRKGVVPRFCLVDRPSVARGSRQGGTSH